MLIRNLRIHGDNIVECERTLKMIAEAYNFTYELLNSPVYFPKYSVKTRDCQFIIELLSGHGRWKGIDLGDIIYKAGGRLRESADSYLTEITGDRETVLLGIEYCSALPAGNNAWQRNGRALASVFANVPYLYYAEIGGIELDENRTPKAPRYPNPAVPFSYVSLSYDMNCVCLPVYRAHPSMKLQNISAYKSALGYDDGLDYIRQILNGEDTTITVNRLKEKAVKMVEILSNERKKKDTLKGKEWNDLLISTNRPSWLVQNFNEKWQKKSSEKVTVSDTFEPLKSKIQSLSVVPITAKDLPFCIVPKQKLPELKAWIKNTYNGLDANFDLNKDLAIVWITGFKPKGDDSRPDRGLSPLCRMILGKDASIMAIVYGPGVKSTWDKLRESYKELCDKNGLFEAIFSCCNYLFVDSVNCKGVFMPTEAKLNKNTKPIIFPYIPKPDVRYFEHDIDCAIHQILSSHKDLGVFECFCNPPGGDWSGISFFKNDKEYKWTSLPRVSEYSKRPDHLFQIERNGCLIFVPIESKGYGKDLENNIGDRLKDYIKDLINSEPTAYKSNDKSNWEFFDGTLGGVKYSSMISVGAFLYKDESELKNQLSRGTLDAIFAFEFGEITTLHFYASNSGEILLDCLKEIESKQTSFIIKVH